MIAVACPYQQINLKALYVYTKTRSDVEKYVCNGLLFLGNLDPSSLTPEGPTVPFVCHFRRQDNLLARCESFVNFYGLKSCIRFGMDTTTLREFIGCIDLQIFVKFRQNIPGIMTKWSMLESFDIWNICPLVSNYATHLAYFSLLQLKMLISRQSIKMS